MSEILGADGKVATTEKEVVVLGLDLALRNTGFVVNEGKKLIGFGTIKTKPFKKPKKQKKEEYFQEEIHHDLTQIQQLDAHINSLVVEHNPDFIVVEVPTFSQNQSSGLALGMVRCALMRYVLGSGPVVHLYQPSSCKRITGDSKRTTKIDVKLAVMKSGYIALAGYEHCIDAQAAVLYWRSTLEESDPLYFKIG